MIVEAVNALAVVKQAADIVKKFDSVELRQLILDLQENILNLQSVIQEKISTNQELQEENFALKSQLQEIQQQKAKAANLIRENQVLWDKTSNDPDPFCPQCWEVENLQVHLKTNSYTYDCQKCSYTAKIPGRTPPPPIIGGARKKSTYWQASPAEQLDT